MKQFKAKIMYNKKIATEHYVLAFNMPRVAGKCVPGQFFNIKIDQGLDPLLRRPFGAHKINEDKVEILYKVVGKATKILSKRKKNSMLDILGPLGNGFEIASLTSLARNDSVIAGRPRRPEAGRVDEAISKRHISTALLVAGGHGVAPLYALAEWLTRNAKQINLSVFIGAQTKKYVIRDNDFKKIGVKVYVATDDGSKGHKGLVTDLLVKMIANLNHCHPERSEGSQIKILRRTYGAPQNDRGTTLFTCGPKPMLKVVAQIAARQNMPCQVSMEEYLGCGIGICMGCAIKTRSGNKLVCKDGPIFDAKEIIWE